MENHSNWLLSLKMKIHEPITDFASLHRVKDHLAHSMTDDPEIISVARDLDALRQHSDDWSLNTNCSFVFPILIGSKEDQPHEIDILSNFGPENLYIPLFFVYAGFSIEIDRTTRAILFSEIQAFLDNSTSYSCTAWEHENPRDYNWFLKIETC